MNMGSERLTGLGGGKASQPLDGLRVMRLGTSRVGRLLAALLAQQGARTVDRNAEVLIDDRTERPAEAPDALLARTRNAATIVIHFTDFPRAHPRWSPRSTLNDEFIHAELGLNRLDGGIAGGAPESEPLPMASAYAAIWASVYVGAALLRRDQCGDGDSIELPLFSAGLTVLARKLLVLADPGLVDPLTVPHLPLAEIYKCADGRYVQSQGHSGRFVEALLTVGGHPEWCEEAVAGQHRLPDRKTEALWVERFTAMFRQRPAAEWEREINALGGACTVCRTAEEWLANEHALQSRILAGAADGSAGAQTGAGVRAFMSASVAESGADGKAAAGDALAGAAAVPRSQQPRDSPPGGQQAAGSEGYLPLAGVRVVDFAVILAGPTCGRTLSEFGADVIKIDAAVRPTSMFGWLDVNRGKRSLAIDMKRPAGLDIVRRLVARADILVENFRVGKLAALGLGFEEAARLRPGIVYASLNCFDFGGPWTGRAGWEHNAQAASGMQVARARDGVPRMVPVPVNDYSTGLLGAYGVLLALRQARATGNAVWVAGSLARSATFIRDTQLFENGADTVAPTRVMRCADGWVRAMLDPDAGATPQALEGMQPVLARLDGRGALAALQARGIVAAIERTVSDLLADEFIDTARLRVSWQHPRWGSLRQVTTIPQASALGSRAGWPAPDPGEDSLAILAELGYGEEDIALLLKAKVVSGRVPLFDQPDA